jgi:zinc transporter 1/2/3
VAKGRDAIDALKLALAGVIFGAAWIGGAIPLRTGIDSKEHLLSWGNAFAGGVFLGVGLVHMLPSAATTWHDDLGTGFPAAFVLAGSAFMLLLLVERVIIDRRVDAQGLGGGSNAIAADVVIAPLQGPSVYPYAAMAALSAHSLFAGLALGAQTAYGDILLIFTAIVLHKSTASFALAVSFVRGHLDRRLAWRLLALFSVTTPLGVVIGTGATAFLAARTGMYMSATFTALAAGTFLYIASVEISDELLRGNGRWPTWLVATAAFAGTAVLALWT